MQVLLFEMKPRDGHEEHYFKHVETLRPLLLEHDGLLFIDRFKSLSRPGIILSHSLWKDEASITKWRTDAQHHQSQAAGRYKHFEDYRIRISHALEHHQSDSDPAIWSHDGSYRKVVDNPSRLLVVTASTQEPLSEGGEAFKSVNIEDSYLTIEETSSLEEAHALALNSKQHKDVTRVILCSISRDYGMYERAEAPQYFKPVDQGLK